MEWDFDCSFFCGSPFLASEVMVMMYHLQLVCFILELFFFDRPIKQLSFKTFLIVKTVEFPNKFFVGGFDVV